MSNTVTQRILPAGMMGGQEAATEAVQGEPIDPTKVAISAGAGALMNKPTGFGEQLLATGARPVQALTGRAHAPAPGAAAPPDTATPPAGENPMPPPSAREQYSFADHLLLPLPSR